MQEAYIYILKDETGRYYIGSTVDLERRVYQHQHGHTQTTRNMKSPKLVFSQKCENISLALKLERRIKGWKRKDFIEKIIKDGYIRIAS